MPKNLIQECYQKSIDLLVKNSTAFGVLASSISKKAVQKNYTSIFGRDACICSLGMVLSENKTLLRSAKNSLKALAKFQANNGQIPNFVRSKEKQVDFWKLGCIDATLWWLIALNFYSRCANDKKILVDLKNNVKQAISWLICQEHNNEYLVMQNEASDWADIMPRSGKVLYSNALWYKVKLLYGIKDAKKTKHSFNILFHPFDAQAGEIPRHNKLTIETIIKKEKSVDYYLSFVNYLFWGGDIDIFGNSLAIIFDLPDKSARDKIIDCLIAKKRNKSLPMPVLFNPIKENSKLWRDYMKFLNQNYSYQYHNGGIWPFASCFWVMALKKAGKTDLAWQEMEKVAEANKINNWQFNEWFHGKTGKPMGMPGQSWNAGAFLLAYHYLNNDFKL